MRSSGPRRRIRPMCPFFRLLHVLLHLAWIVLLLAPLLLVFGLEVVPFIIVIVAFIVLLTPSKAPPPPPHG